MTVRGYQNSIVGDAADLAASYFADGAGAARRLN